VENVRRFLTGRSPAPYRCSDTEWRPCADSRKRRNACAVTMTVARGGQGLSRCQRCHGAMVPRGRQGATGPRCHGAEKVPRGQGATGATGPTRCHGAKVPRGRQGATGPRCHGAKVPRGQGATGPTRCHGAMVPRGRQGATGPRCHGADKVPRGQGATGRQGATGPRCRTRALWHFGPVALWHSGTLFFIPPPSQTPSASSA